MPVTLLKLSMTATAPTTQTFPTASGFFNTAPVGGYTGSASYTIADIDWVDDSGSAVTAGSLIPVTTDDGYVSLYINGQLQESDMLTVLSTTEATITFDSTTTIEEGKIISLIVTNFAPITTAPIISG